MTSISAYSIEIDPDLDSDLLCPNNDFRIYYTTDPNHPDLCVTIAEVNDLCSQLNDLLNIYTNPSLDYRFNDPTRGNEFPVQIKPGGGGGMAFCNGSDCGITLAPDIFTVAYPLSLESVPLHEMFHQVQYTYGSWSSFFSEGTASMMQDKVYTNLDQSTGLEMASYFREANWFLDTQTDNSLIDLSYSACLFWTYITEQYGTITTEPQVGVDFIRGMLNNHDSGSDDIQRINSTLNDFVLGVDFQSVFMDFIVANYAKDLTGASVPDKYLYIDDDLAPGQYNRPYLTLNRYMPVGDVISATDEIRSWGAKYYEARPSIDAPIISVEFHQVSSVTMVYNLLVIKNDDLVMDLCEFNVLGTDFVRSLVNDEFDKVVVIAGALDHPVSFRYTFSTGGGIPTLNILWPLTNDWAKVDKDDLNKFQVHLEIVGPGGAVLSGLEPDDFEVTVDGDVFNIVTGHEVMGQYWLVVQPIDLGTGFYHLTVSLTAGTISDTEFWAVEFTDVINSDNVLVIDRSGSMLEPDWTGPTYETPDPTDKIYGAIDAASLYIDSFRDGDKMGLVWFSHDAHTTKILQDITAATRVHFQTALNTFDQNESGA
ncbi:MAG: hypothetical protein ACMUIU_08245 [bacterium]